jgi:hypothetical protein
VGREGESGRGIEAGVEHQLLPEALIRHPIVEKADVGLERRPALVGEARSVRRRQVADFVRGLEKVRALAQVPHAPNAKPPVRVFREGLGRPQVEAVVAEFLQVFRTDVIVKEVVNVEVAAIAMKEAEVRMGPRSP